MRIGFDAKRYFHNQTGLGNYARTLVNGLIELYPEHSYYLFDSKPSELPKSAANIIKKPKLRPLWRQFGISKDIQRQQLDVYHGLSAELPYTRPKKTKMVVTIHDLIFMKYPQYYKTIDRLIYAHKTDNALRSADAIIATSEQTKRDLIKIMPDEDIPIQVIYQDCDPLFYVPTSETDLAKTRERYQLPEKFLVMVSKFEQRKNHLTLLKALKQGHPDGYPIVLVGKPGDTFAEVEQFIDANQLGNRVKILSDVPSRDLPNVYRLAEASIFPSLYEGFGIPVLESLACGTPVLTSEQSCMQEIANDAGLYFNPTETDSINEALLTFDKSGIADKLEAAIPDRLELFSNRKILADHNTLYQKICSK